MRSYRQDYTKNEVRQILFRIGHFRAYRYLLKIRKIQRLSSSNVQHYYSDKYFEKYMGGTERISNTSPPPPDMAVKESGSLEGKRILDFGCGRGDLIMHAISSNATEILGIDYSQNAIDKSHKLLRRKNITKDVKVSLACGGIDILHSIERQTFDIVFLTDVLEHISTIEAAKLLKQLHRIIDKNDYIVFVTPNGSNIFHGYNVDFFYYPLLYYYLFRTQSKKTSYSEFFVEDLYYQYLLHINILSYSELYNLFKNNGFNPVIKFEENESVSINKVKKYLHLFCNTALASNLYGRAIKNDHFF